MRLLEMMVNLTALTFGLAVLSFLVVLVAAFELLGVLIAGLVVLVITYSVELEDGSAQSPELLAMQRLEQAESPEEWAARRAERRERLSRLKVAKLFGFALVAVGALGFYFVQL